MKPTSSIFIRLKKRLEPFRAGGKDDEAGRCLRRCARVRHPLFVPGHRHSWIDPDANGGVSRWKHRLLTTQAASLVRYKKTESR